MIVQNSGHFYIHKTKIRVRYADTDQMQVVYNGKYFEYFEVGRTELLRSLGLPYSEFEKTGIRLPLIEAHCNFFIPARYDNLITIESRVSDLFSPRLRIEYSLFLDDSSRLLASGYTIHCFQDICTGKPIRPPQHFIEALKNNIPVD